MKNKRVKKSDNKEKMFKQGKSNAWHYTDRYFDPEDYKEFEEKYGVPSHFSLPLKK